MVFFQTMTAFAAYPESYNGEATISNVPAGNVIKEDHFGNQYSYNPETWYTDFFEDYCYNKDDTNHTITLLFGRKEKLPENLYIPGETTINGVKYTTQFYLENVGLMTSSPFRGSSYGGERIKHIYIDSKVKVLGGESTLSYAFDGCYNLESADLTGVDFSAVTTFNNFFSYCYNLKQVAFAEPGEKNNTTRNVTGMYQMFAWDRSITSTDDIQLSSIDTSSVINMAAVFGKCSSLEKADVSSFDFRNVTTMEAMFTGCTSLKKFEFPDTDTSKCESIEDMFVGCTALKTLDLSGLKTDKLTNMKSLVDADMALIKFCLPEKLDYFNEVFGNIYCHLPKEMYHNGDPYKEGTTITSEMGGWIFTAEDDMDPDEIRVLSMNSTENFTSGSDTYTVSWNSFTRFDGRNHLGTGTDSSGNVYNAKNTKSKVTDIVVQVAKNGELIDPSKYKITTKNNKKASVSIDGITPIQTSSKKLPSFTIKFKGADYKAVNKAVKGKKFGFGIIPAKLTENRLEFKECKLKNGNWKLINPRYCPKPDGDVNLKPVNMKYNKKASKTDYEIQETSGGNVAVLGRNNYYGSVVVMQSAK